GVQTCALPIYLPGTITPVDNNSRLAALLRPPPSLRPAAASDEWPLGLKFSFPAMDGTDVDEFVLLSWIVGQKDLSRYLAAHYPRPLVDHGVAIQRPSQPSCPAGIIDGRAVEPLQVQDPGHEPHHQVPQHSAILQPLQGADQPGRIWWGDVHDLDLQDLAGVGIFDEGDVLVRALEDHCVRPAFSRDLICQIDQEGSIPGIHPLRIEGDLLARSDQLQILDLSHEALPNALHRIEAGAVPADKIPGGKVDGSAPLLPVLYAHEFVVV